jgi:hypothetical protein
MSYQESEGKPQPHSKMASKNICAWSILVILSIIMVSCGETPQSTSTASPTPSGPPVDVAPPPTPLVCPSQQNGEPNDFVSTNGPTFVHHGSPITFYGYTYYPASIAR